METATTEAIETEEAAEEEVSTPVKESLPGIFRYSEYVDIPQGCDVEEVLPGSCKDPDHFHAWVRLPNKFQHKEIRERAMAARARRQRQLRDLESDSRVVLEDDLDVLITLPKEEVIEEILSYSAGSELTEALKDVQEIEAEHQIEGEDTAMKYANVSRDEERLGELEREGVREGDEFEELTKHVHSYYQAIEEAQKEHQRPEREGLEARTVEDLVDLVRQNRIETEGTEEFLHTYNTWMVVYGTMISNRSGRKFGDYEALKAQAPEVVDQLMVAFSALESGAREGNS